jgi:hypothetical protein
MCFKCVCCAIQWLTKLYEDTLDRIKAVRLYLISTMHWAGQSFVAALCEGPLILELSGMQ